MKSGFISMKYIAGIFHGEFVSERIRLPQIGGISNK